MGQPIRIGDRAFAEGPLKPAGQVSIDGQIVNAKSDGSWIDHNAEVEVIGGNQGSVLVRHYSVESARCEGHGDTLPVKPSFETTPLRSPPTWVEKINAKAIGGGLGLAAVPIWSLAGTPIDLTALLPPVAGVIAGSFFGYSVRQAIESVGPREDHRSRARAIALIVALGMVVGVAVAWNLGLGFVGLSGGLVGGVLAGGMLCFVGFLISNV